MKLLLALVLTLGSLGAFADHHEEDGKTFEESKTKMTSHLDKKIENLQAAKSCVSAAKDKEGLKACHKQLKDKHKEMKEQHKEMKKKNKK